MVLLQGTVVKINHHTSRISSPSFIIGIIRQENGEEAKIKGNISTNAELNDCLIGNFEETINEYGKCYETKGVIEVKPPSEPNAILDRCIELARGKQIRFTTQIRERVVSLSKNANFWEILQKETGSDSFTAFLKTVNEYNLRYISDFKSSVDIETYFKNLGLKWSENTIRKLAGYEKDCEEPTRKEITVAELKEDPFILLEVPGIKDNQIEEYLKSLNSLGIIDNETLQVGILILKVKKAENNQHTCVPIEVELLPVSHESFRKHLSIYNNCLYRKHTYYEEKNISEFVGNLISSHPNDRILLDNQLQFIRDLPADEGRIPTEDQCLAVEKMFSQPILLLLGYAGTGKTTTLRLLCRYVIKHLSFIRSNILFLAPTGKAVQRVRDSIENINMSETNNTMTIHRFYGIVNYIANHECTSTCEKNGCKAIEDKPTWYDDKPNVIIVDETSMVDTHTMGLFRNAVNMLMKDEDYKPHIVFIGDDGQLQPVGCGNPLIDMISSGIVPIHRLKKIHRQGEETALAKALVSFRKGKPCKEFDDAFNITSVSDKTLESKLHAWVDGHKSGTNTIVAPTNELVDKLTGIVREHVNPKTSANTLLNGKFEFKYRINDKIIQKKNNYERTVFNGTIGDIVGKEHHDKKITKANGSVEVVKEIRLVVKFQGRDNLFYYTYDEAISELNLAYAITTHKAQGSEYDHVLVVFDKSIRNFINRNLIYTAASRGKKDVLLMLYSPSIESNFKDFPCERRTNLRKMIEDSVDYE